MEAVAVSMEDFFFMKLFEGRPQASSTSRSRARRFRKEREKMPPGKKMRVKVDRITGTPLGMTVNGAKEEGSFGCYITRFVPTGIRIVRPR